MTDDNEGDLSRSSNKCVPMRRVLSMRKYHDLSHSMVIKILRFFSLLFDLLEVLFLIVHFHILIVSTYLFDMRVCVRKLENKNVLQIYVDENQMRAI